MHGNLKNAINKIAKEMVDFPNEYNYDQEQINLRITDIIQNLITPIILENKKLKEELQTPYKKIDELNTQIHDIVAQNINRMK